MSMIKVKNSLLYRPISTVSEERAVETFRKQDEILREGKKRNREDTDSNSDMVEKIKRSRAPSSVDTIFSDSGENSSRVHTHIPLLQRDHSPTFLQSQYKRGDPTAIAITLPHRSRTGQTDPVVHQSSKVASKQLGPAVSRTKLSTVLCRPTVSIYDKLKVLLLVQGACSDSLKQARLEAVSANHTIGYHTRKIDEMNREVSSTHRELEAHRILRDEQLKKLDELHESNITLRLDHSAIAKMMTQLDQELGCVIRNHLNIVQSVDHSIPSRWRETWLDMVVGGSQKTIARCRERETLMKLELQAAEISEECNKRCLSGLDNVVESSGKVLATSMAIRDGAQKAKGFAIQLERQAILREKELVELGSCLVDVQHELLRMLGARLLMVRLDEAKR